MPTFKQAFEAEKRWVNKTLILDLFHNTMLVKKKKWSLRDTARVMNISLGAVSENLQLAKALNETPNIADLTRDQALRIVREKNDRKS